MIRQATKYDKKIINNLMLQYKNESQIDYFKNLGESEYWNELLAGIFAGRGIIFLAEDYGILLAIIFPCIWSDKIMFLHELAWYVTPQKRGSSAGYKLIKAYLNYGNKLKKENKIQAFTISKMPSSPNINYGRFGFKKIDENWIQ